MGKIKDRTREKVALVVFVILLILVSLGLLAYFSFGRTLSVAATMVDEAVGRMGDYTVLVYTAPDEASAQGEGDVGDETTAASAADTQNQAGTVLSETSTVPTDADTIGMRIMSYYSIVNPNGLENVDPADVVTLYEEKDASVCQLDISAYGIDSTPSVIQVDDKGIGIFYAAGYKSDIQISKTIERLKEQGANTVMCITERLDTLQSVSGLSAVIVTGEYSGISDEGERIDDTLIISLPNYGEVGVIMLSSNNVASARVIDAL